MLVLKLEFTAGIPVLGRTLGTSAEDTTFYGLHYIKGSSTGTAQPSTPANKPSQGCKDLQSPPRSNLSM